MALKPNHLVIPLVTIAVAVLGSMATGQGMDWYNLELIKPALTPPKWAFPVAWNTIFVLTTASALIFWSKGATKSKIVAYFTDKTLKNKFRLITDLFIANAILNVLWSVLFFAWHLTEVAFIEMLILETVIIATMTLLWKISKTASLLLLPYALWIVMATYLTFEIMRLN